jgi:signal transduction histidine kinase
MLRQNDELGALAGAFNVMAGKIHDSQRDLKGKVQEHLLAEKELEETNRKLEATLDQLSATTQQLWQASKLATMGELAASVAHELNNPLATVALHAESLVGQAANNEQNRTSLEVILQENERMAALVNNLLQFSRRGHRQISTVDVREEITNSVEFLRYHLRNRRIEVVFDFAETLPAIHADRQQLRQLFLNLLTNASDALANGGQLKLRVATDTLNGEEAVLVEFVDNGEGMPPENITKVWDPFFTTKPEGKGTGLGLGICRRIVESHGGNIGIESEVGKGTTVRILLPPSTKDIGI